MHRYIVVTAENIDAARAALGEDGINGPLSATGKMSDPYTAFIAEMKGNTYPSYVDALDGVVPYETLYTQKTNMTNVLKERNDWLLTLDLQMITKE